MARPRRLRRAIRLELALAAVGALAAPARAQSSLPERVNAAIDHGVAWLRPRQRPDGSFPASHNYPVGETALCAYALLKSGVPSNDPAVQKAIGFVRYQPLKHTYTTAAAIFAFDALGDPTQDGWIRDAAKWLEDHQHKSGLWSYPDGKDDLSNTQYAALGMWVAERHGFKSKKETWAALTKELARRQLADGGFGYREGDAASGSMTTSGIATLELALARTKDEPRFLTIASQGRDALKRAWTWLATNFSIEGNPASKRTFTPGHHLYYLFGLERVAAIGERKKIGDHDWYAEGAAHLLEKQQPSGSWNDAGDGTCFALLFLRRATFTGMHHDERDPPRAPADGAAPAAGATGSANSAVPTRPVAEVPYVKRWLVAGPIPDPKDELLDQPFAPESELAPHAGEHFRGRPWIEHRSLEDFVDLAAAAGPADHVLYCAFTFLDAERDEDVVAWLGTDDGGRLFLDGSSIFARHVHQEAKRDRSHVPIHLTAGLHRLLLKVDNFTGLTGFYLRLARPDGTTSTSVRPTLSRTEPDLAATALAQPGLFPLATLRAVLPTMPRSSISFDTAKDLELVAFDRVSVAHEYPRFLDAPEPKPDNPHPGARGILEVEPLAPDLPCRLYLRAKLPAGAPKLAARVSCNVYGSPGKADFVLRLGVFEEKLDWRCEETVGGEPAPDPKGWHVVEADLAPYAGKDVLLVIEVAAGGREAWNCEQAFFDEIGVR